ncbi:MAG: SprB repeat-containing protein, partial [Flavobacteriales bacterium]
IYPYTVTDLNGCSQSDTITITEPNDITVSSSTTNVSCNGGNDGTAILTLSGGTGTLTPNWGTNNPISLAAGTYNYIVTDSNLCVDSGSVTITEPSEIIIVTDSITEVSVYGGNDGAIYISPNGGGGNYTYNWSGPSSYSSVNEDIIGLYFGDYIITVTNSANCSQSDTIFVDQAPSLIVSVDAVINLLCFEECNGQINITANGGDSVYTYLWTGPNGFSSTDEDLDSLCAGTYELVVSDSTNSIYATIVVNQPTQLQIITNVDTALCYGGTAQASAFTYEGQNPYSTNWDNGSSSITTYLTAGIHYVNVMDFNGCSISDSVLIIQNDSMSISTTNTDISCYGLTDGSIAINVDSGGTAPFTYSDDNGQSFQSSNTFYSLGIGLYSFIVIDSNGCTNSVSGRITEPDELIVTLSSTNVICHGDSNGTAIANISGGTSPYNEDWGGLEANNLSAGLVNVIVTDSNGCLSSNFVIILEPNPVIVMITVNGTTLEATPGFPSYQWIDENGNNILGATAQSYTPNTAGEYFVQVVDYNGCVGESIKINFIIESVGDISSHLSIYPNPTNSWVT